MTKAIGHLHLTQRGVQRERAFVYFEHMSSFLNFLHKIIIKKMLGTLKDYLGNIPDPCSMFLSQQFSENLYKTLTYPTTQKVTSSSKIHYRLVCLCDKYHLSVCVEPVNKNTLNLQTLQ